MTIAWPHQHEASHLHPCLTMHQSTSLQSQLASTFSRVCLSCPGPCSKPTKLLKSRITPSHVVNSSHDPVHPNHLEPCTHTRRRFWQLDACVNNMLLVFHTMPCQAVHTTPTLATAFATPYQLALATDKQLIASSLKMSPIAACALPFSLAIKGYEKGGRRLVQGEREKETKKGGLVFFKEED